MFEGKSVYILGAGASVHAGAPLLRNFLSTSWSLLRKNQDLKFLNSFEMVSKWIKGYRQNSSPAQIDFDNLEDVFSMVDLASLMGDAEAAEIRKHLINVIFETLDVSMLLDQEYDRISDKTYWAFSASLYAHNQMRQNTLRSGTYRPDSVISFNYDPLLDIALAQKQWNLNYHLTGSTMPEFAGNLSLDIFKLHGSMNWVRHDKCDAINEKSVHVIPPTSLLKNRIGRGSQFNLSTYASLSALKCPAGCNYQNVLEPVFVPPTWAKNPNSSWMAPLWARAAATFSDAEQIIIAGYSLPASDSFFKYLLSIGLHKNSDLKRVIVVNSNPDDDLLNRYKKVFPHMRVDLIQDSFADMAGDVAKVADRR